MRRFLQNPVFSIESGLLISHEGETWEEPAYLFDRSLRSTAGTAAKQAGTTATNLGSEASSEKSAILPGLEREAANPTGYTPTQMNDQLVAGEQGAGGANSSISGEAALRAGRTRNSAGFGSVLDEAARDKTRQLSENALNIKGKSADLGQKKQMFAQSQIGNMYGTDTHAMLSAMGLIPEDIKAGAAADSTGWVQNFAQIMNALKPSGGGGGGAGAGAAG